MHDALAKMVGSQHVLASDRPRYDVDHSETAGLSATADAIVLPGSAEEVRDLVAWCYANDVAMVPRGGGTGLSGGAVPVGLDGPAILLCLERLQRVRAFDPGQWRCHVEAGVTTGTLQRLARESGLLFAVDPGAPEQSQIGGNIATNAGGPHCFKYGVMRQWVMGVEAVLAPGELVTVGGPVRKDVAGYDLTSLLCGSEGTLGVITAAWLRLLPRPSLQVPVAATFADTAEGCAAIERVLACGVVPATIEYLDAGALQASGAAFPGQRIDDAGFLVVCEVDSTQADVAELCAALGVTARAFTTRSEREALWRWRDGVSFAVAAVCGGKLSEDIAVPLDRLAEAIDGTLEIGARHGLPACSWGHAGDGNVHSTFMFDRADAELVERSAAAAHDLFALAIGLGGTISGEHGLGWLKRGQLRHQWAPGAVHAHNAIKAALDPKGLLNPGKKQP